MTKNKHFPVLIDEEGSNVTRLSEIISHNISANFFGNLYEINKIFCLKILKHYIFSLSKFLTELGININIIPVLDVLRNRTSKVIEIEVFLKIKKLLKILEILQSKIYT